MSRLRVRPEHIVLAIAAAAFAALSAVGLGQQLRAQTDASFNIEEYLRGRVPSGTFSSATSSIYWTIPDPSYAPTLTGQSSSFYSFPSDDAFWQDLLNQYGGSSGFSSVAGDPFGNVPIDTWWSSSASSFSIDNFPFPSSWHPAAGDGSMSSAPSCTFTDLVPDTLEEQAVLNLCARGVVTGKEPGLAAPGSTLNRAEAATLLVRMLAFPQTSPGMAPFPDVAASEWYAGPIATAKQAGIVTGYDDGWFRPQNPVTRAEWAAMLDRAFPPAAMHAAPPEATDVLATEWYYEPVARSLARGLFPGDPDAFRPNWPISRGAAFIAAYLATR